MTANDNQPAEAVANGDYCRVVGGAHQGKEGTVEDCHTSASGNETITVRLGDGDRVKTLARNVELVRR